MGTQITGSNNRDETYPLPRTAAASPFAPRALFSEQQPNGASSTTPSVGGAWNKRALNTSIFNNIPGCTFDALNSRFHLAPGTYNIQVEAVANDTGGTMLDLFNFTTGAAFPSTTANALSQNAGTTGQDVVFLEFEAILSAPADIEVHQYTAVTSSLGLPVTAPADGLGVPPNECYCNVSITQIG